MLLIFCLFQEAWICLCINSQLLVSLQCMSVQLGIGVSNPSLSNKPLQVSGLGSGVGSIVAGHVRSDPTRVVTAVETK